MISRQKARAIEEKKKKIAETQIRESRKGLRTEVCEPSERSKSKSSDLGGVSGKIAQTLKVNRKRRHDSWDAGA